MTATANTATIPNKDFGRLLHAHVPACLLHVWEGNTPDAG